MEIPEIVLKQARQAHEEGRLEGFLSSLDPAVAEEVRRQVLGSNADEGGNVQNSTDLEPEFGRPNSVENVDENRAGVNLDEIDYSTDLGKLRYLSVAAINGTKWIDLAPEVREWLVNKVVQQTEKLYVSIEVQAGLWTVELKTISTGEHAKAMEAVKDVPPGDLRSYALAVEDLSYAILKVTPKIKGGFQYDSELHDRDTIREFLSKAPAEILYVLSTALSWLNMFNRLAQAYFSDVVQNLASQSGGTPTP